MRDAFINRPVVLFSTFCAFGLGFGFAVQGGTISTLTPIDVFAATTSTPAQATQLSKDSHNIGEDVNSMSEDTDRTGEVNSEDSNFADSSNAINGGLSPYSPDYLVPLVELPEGREWTMKSVATDLEVDMPVVNKTVTETQHGYTVEASYGWLRPHDGRISSYYGYRGAISSIGLPAGFHNGVDFAGDMNSPIYASKDGEVIHVGYSDYGIHSGGTVVIEHEDDTGTYRSVYNHMRLENIYVQLGDKVSKGDVIAGVGSEGYSTGPHLHFSIYKLVSGFYDALNPADVVENF